MLKSIIFILSYLYSIAVFANSFCASPNPGYPSKKIAAVTPKEYLAKHGSATDN